MKLLLDQCLSRRLVPMLEPVYPGTTHVTAHGLETEDDDVVWRFARDHGFTLATKDEDFQVLSFSRGHPPKVIWLRSGNGPTAQVHEILTRARGIIVSFGEDHARSLLVLP